MDETAYGPNQEVILLGGTVSLGCDGLYRQSDVYVVSAGTVADGVTSALVDESGSPNPIWSSSVASQFDSVTLGWTAPAGNIKPGTYDLVEDVCQDEQFDPGQDSILRDAFTVAPAQVGVPVPPASQISAVKADAQARAAEVRVKSFALNTFVFLYGKIPGKPTWASAVTWDGPKDVIKYYMKQAFCVKMMDIAFVTRQSGSGLKLVKKFCKDLIDSAPWDSMDDGLGPREAAELLVDHRVRVYEAIAADPPDLDFTAPVALPSSAVYPATEDQVDRIFQDLLSAQDAEARAGEAFLHALEKYQGAQAAKDAPAALAQAQAVSAYARQLTAALGAGASARESWIAFDDAASNPITPEVVGGFNELHARLNSTGVLTDEERQVLIDAGLNEEDIVEFIQLVKQDEMLGAPYVSLSDWHADALASEAATAAAFEELADAFDAIVTQLEQDITDAGLGKYPSVTLSGPSSAVVGESVTVTADADSGYTLAWDTDGDGEFDDGSGLTASAQMLHLGSNAVGALVTDGAGRQAITYHTVNVSYPASYPQATSVSPNPGQTVHLADGETELFEVEASHPDNLSVTVTWYVNGEEAGAGPSVEVTGDENSVFQSVQAKLASSDGLAEWVWWEIETSPPPPPPPTLTAEFAARASTGLVDVAWDRAGGTAVGASSAYSASYSAAQVINAGSGRWQTAADQTTDQWLTLDLGRDWDISAVLVTPYISYAPTSVRLSIDRKSVV
jgi:hypothetical protein